MTYSDYVIEYGGHCSAVITLPCFSGEDDFSVCSRMNGFYEKALGMLYAYHTELCENETIRSRLRCRYQIEPERKGLRITLCISYSENGRQPVRRYISHLWKNGYVISCRRE